MSGEPVDPARDALAKAVDLREQADALRAQPLPGAVTPDALARAMDHRMATVSALLGSAVVYAAEAIVLSNEQRAA